MNEKHLWHPAELPSIPFMRPLKFPWNLQIPEDPLPPATRTPDQDGSGPGLQCQLHLPAAAAEIEGINSIWRHLRAVLMVPSPLPWTCRGYSEVGSHSCPLPGSPVGPHDQQDNAGQLKTFSLKIIIFHEYHYGKKHSKVKDVINTCIYLIKYEASLTTENILTEANKHLNE